MTRAGSVRWVVLVGVTVVGVSVALAARGERAPARSTGPTRFAGSTTVIPMPSILPATTLWSPVRVALVRDPAAASYFTKTTSYDSIIDRWTTTLRATQADVRVVAPSEIAASNAQVLVIPSSHCLSVATREAIDRAAARGQGLVVTGAIGTKDARCRPIGYGLLVALTGASRIEPLEKRDIAYVTFPSGGALATGIPPGTRLELDPAPYVALRRAGRDAFFSSFALRPSRRAALASSTARRCGRAMVARASPI